MIERVVWKPVQIESDKPIDFLGCDKWIVSAHTHNIIGIELFCRVHKTAQDVIFTPVQRWNGEIGRDFTQNTVLWSGRSEQYDLIEHHSARRSQQDPFQNSVLAEVLEHLGWKALRADSCLNAAQDSRFA